MGSNRAARRLRSIFDNHYLNRLEQMYKIFQLLDACRIMGLYPSVKPLFQMAELASKENLVFEVCMNKHGEGTDCRELELIEVADWLTVELGN